MERRGVFPLVPIRHVDVYSAVREPAATRASGADVERLREVLTPAHKDVLHDEHVKILDAVRRHGVAGAVAAMARHVDRDLPLYQGAPK